VGVPDVTVEDYETQLRFVQERVRSGGPYVAAAPATSPKYGTSRSPLVQVTS
jgi:hypothetical protein